MKSKNVLSKIKNYLFDELKYFKDSIKAIRAERVRNRLNLISIQKYIFYF